LVEQLRVNAEENEILSRENAYCDKFVA